MVTTKQLIVEVKQLVERNYENPEFNVYQLCEETRVSRASMYRKMKSYCQCGPKQYIDDIRFEIAKRKIENNECEIKSLAYEVGFSDQDYFSKRFKHKYSVSPSEYKKLFNK